MSTHYDFVLSEGDLQAIMQRLSQLRGANPDKPYCLQMSFDAIPDGIGIEITGLKVTIEELKTDAIREMFEKGQLGE